MLLDDDSREYTCINTCKGLFVYNPCSFGIKKCQRDFPALYEKPTARRIPFVVAFQDDVLISGANDADHLANLNEVLRRIHDANLKVKKSKCRFLQPEIEFPGRVLNV